MDRISVMNISVHSAIAREIFQQIMIFCGYLHQIVNIKVNGQISFELSTWMLNYAIESLFKFYTLCENHSFSQLLGTNHITLKNSNCDVPISMWLLSIEIFPKGIFIFIWCSSVQTKVHKENIRTNYETQRIFRTLSNI